MSSYLSPSAEEVPPPIHIGTGCLLRFFRDPSDSASHCAVTTYDGLPGSLPLIVPNHWHEESDEYMTVLEGEVEFSIDGRR